jgi:pilus assembly protein CpaF
LIVQLLRFGDGARRITTIAEIACVGPDSELELREIFAFVRTGTQPGGKITGEHRASGYKLD